MYTHKSFQHILHIFNYYLKHFEKKIENTSKLFTKIFYF